MCGAYGFSVKDAQEVYDRFEITNQLADFNPRWNLRPGQMNPVITSDSPNQISRMFWGLIPHWAKDKTAAFKTINARAETVADKPTYRDPLRRKRCIVPATGFYEPDKINFAKPPFPWHYFQVKNEKMIGSDFSVVLFRSNFMLVSEKDHMKVHTNQWLLTMPYPLECLSGATRIGHTRAPGDADAFTVATPYGTPK